MSKNQNDPISVSWLYFSVLRVSQGIIGAVTSGLDLLVYRKSKKFATFNIPVVRVCGFYCQSPHLRMPFGGSSIRPASKGKESRLSKRTQKRKSRRKTTER